MNFKAISAKILYHMNLRGIRKEEVAVPNLREHLVQQTVEPGEIHACGD